jgi:hypothetical protein
MVMGQERGSERIVYKVVDYFISCKRFGGAG